MLLALDEPATNAIVHQAGCYHLCQLDMLLRGAQQAFLVLSSLGRENLQDPEIH